MFKIHQTKRLIIGVFLLTLAIPNYASNDPDAKTIRPVRLNENIGM